MSLAIKIISSNPLQQEKEAITGTKNLSDQQGY